MGKKKKSPSKKEHGHGGGHGHGEEKKKKPKKIGGIVQIVSYKEQHAGHGHFEDEMDKRMDEKNINGIIKAKANKRYGASSAQTEQYIEIAEKYVKRNQHKLQMSIDTV